tara:strand:- start:5012 stop:5674 length:663 start_codon:yes stop_codon:yes gene_type:complete
MTEHKLVDHGNFGDNFFTEIPIKNKEANNIFPTYLYEFDLDIDNESIVEECHDLRRMYPRGVTKSNHGGGWQSYPYELDEIKPYTTPHIQNLARNVVDLTAHMMEENGSEWRPHDGGIGWWININEGMGYNVYHTHPGCAIIGLYYPAVPDNLKENEGVFTVLRQDPMNHNVAYAEIDENCEYSIRPKVGTVYLMPSCLAHYVTPHFSKQERISIAFNIG